MSDMSLPERILLALERDGLTPAGLRRRDLPIPSEEERLDDKVVIRDAARRFALLTSPETIEKGAKAINAVFSDAMNRPTDWDSLPDHEKEQFKDEAEAVLRAVEERNRMKRCEVCDWPLSLLPGGWRCTNEKNHDQVYDDEFGEPLDDPRREGLGDT